MKASQICLDLGEETFCDTDFGISYHKFKKDDISIRYEMETDIDDGSLLAYDLFINEGDNMVYHEFNAKQVIIYKPGSWEEVIFDIYENEMAK